jgi:hypothetical protein
MTAKCDFVTSYRDHKIQKRVHSTHKTRAYKKLDSIFNGEIFRFYGTMDLLQDPLKESELWKIVSTKLFEKLNTNKFKANRCVCGQPLRHCNFVSNGDTDDNPIYIVGDTCLEYLNGETIQNLRKRLNKRVYQSWKCEIDHTIPEGEARAYVRMCLKTTCVSDLVNSLHDQRWSIIDEWLNKYKAERDATVHSIMANLVDKSVALSEIRRHEDKLQRAQIAKIVVRNLVRNSILESQKRRSAQNRRLAFLKRILLTYMRTYIVPEIPRPIEEDEPPQKRQ